LFCQIDDALSRASKFLSQTAQAVIEANGCHPYFGIDCASSAEKACRLMLEKGVNRLGVTRGGVLLSTVTLSDIVELIARGHSDVTRPDQPIDIPQAVLTRTIEEAATSGQAPYANVGVRELKRGSISDGVLVVRNSDRLLRCFGGVATDGAVGVVDEKGVLIGNVSSWDLKLVNHHSLVSFSLPISDFLKTVRDANMLPSDYLVTVKLWSSIGALLKKFADNHVDRIYVVDEDGKPVGVVDNATLLRILLA
jgi:CBS domain-containing protein